NCCRPNCGLVEQPATTSNELAPSPRSIVRLEKRGLSTPHMLTSCPMWIRFSQNLEPMGGCCDPRPYRRLASLEPDSATLAWATLPTTGSGGSEGEGWRRRGREASGKDKQSGAASIDIPPMQGA